MFNKKVIKLLIPFIGIVLCSGTLAFASSEGGHENLGNHLPIWSCIPFIGMLLSLAIVPLIKPHWWEHNLLKVAIFWSLLFLIPFGIAFGSELLLFYIFEIVLLDYIPFIVLLFGLFVSAGGIALRGRLCGNTKTNVILLLIGTLLASWVGTTGAAMLMIRPVIKANAWREKKEHVIIFFIFLVANIGGCLTPVGDPPLFLGFLAGIPFFSTMRLFPIMIFNVSILLIIFIFLDKILMRKEILNGRTPELTVYDEGDESLRIEGAHNLIFIIMIVGAVILSGILPGFDTFANQDTGELYGVHLAGVVFPYNSVVEITIILLASMLSLVTTRKATRECNGFSFAPIEEVAKIFIGIFLTMIPALAILKANGASLGLSEPWQFFWATGILSSLLDNAPTYLVFLTTAGSIECTEGICTSLGIVGIKVLMAISAGAVFMGANTYIGNAPNFMVKSIAEESDIKMPSFFGYMAWSFVILIPLFILDTLIFYI